MTRPGDRGQARQGLLLFALYLSAILTPGFHALLHPGLHHCERCQAATQALPALQDHCDGSCGDPDHHHHRRDGREQCILCTQLPAPAQLLPTSEVTCLPPGDLTWAGRDPALVPPSTCQLRLERARAPPHCIAL